MSGQTKIEWCDATFNPWVGCTKVSPGCAHCYAETWAKRTGQTVWGDDGARRRTSAAKWREPRKWAARAREGLLPDGTANPDGHRPRVFCASLADVFEEQQELDPWRRDLFDLIDGTPELDWLLLTKRPAFAYDWLGSMHFTGDGWPNVWVGTSIENARHTWRADVLREIPAAVRFISAEPLLGSLFEDPPDLLKRPARNPDRIRKPLDLTGIDWLIVGGESGPGARPMRLEWARELVTACREHGVAPFVKQLGAKPIGPSSAILAEHRSAGAILRLRDRKGGDMSEWPEDLHVREWPR